MYCLVCIYKFTILFWVFFQRVALANLFNEGTMWYINLLLKQFILLVSNWNFKHFFFKQIMAHVMIHLIMGESFLLSTLFTGIILCWSKRFWLIQKLNEKIFGFLLRFCCITFHYLQKKIILHSTWCSFNTVIVVAQIAAQLLLRPFACKIWYETQDTVFSLTSYLCVMCYHYFESATNVRINNTERRFLRVPS